MTFSFFGISFVLSNFIYGNVTKNFWLNRFVLSVIRHYIFWRVWASLSPLSLPWYRYCTVPLRNSRVDDNIQLLNSLILIVYFRKTWSCTTVTIKEIDTFLGKAPAFTRYFAFYKSISDVIKLLACCYASSDSGLYFVRWGRFQILVEA